MVDGEKVDIHGDMNLAQSVLHFTVNGKPMTSQIASKKPWQVE